MWSWLWPILVGVAVAKGLMMWVISFAEVPSGSMYPTIPVNPPEVPHPVYILVDHLATELHKPYRGEIVLFPWPDDPKEVFVKRIIGMPGDTLAVHKGHVYINGHVLYEPYLTQATTGTYGPVKVPPGHYFMMGDNRAISDDSRSWQHPFVPASTIIGRADLVIWPLNDIKVIR
ncbi:MAG: signal peptidase I [Alicyclobacillus sp.]|nr:signal peptidase I [Alicyclobacillus sp.]